MKHHINIPESLEDIKLDHLIKFSKVDKENEDEIMIKAFDLFCGTPYKVVRSLPINFVNETLGKINNVLNQRPEERLTFEMNGVTYGRIPNLDKISLGEYADLDTFITPAFKDEIKHEDAFRFLSVLYRPVKDEVKGLYRIVDYDDEYINKEMWTEFKQHCPADIYLSSVSFFLRLRIELQKVLRSYLRQLGAKYPKQESNLVKTGDGIAVYTAMLKDNLSQSKSRAKTMFCLPSLTFPMKRTVENLRTKKEEIKK